MKSLAAFVVLTGWLSLAVQADVQTCQANVVDSEECSALCSVYASDPSKCGHLPLGHCVVANNPQCHPQWPFAYPEPSEIARCQAAMTSDPSCQEYCLQFAIPPWSKECGGHQLLTECVLEELAHGTENCIKGSAVAIPVAAVFNPHVVHHIKKIKSKSEGSNFIHVSPHASPVVAAVDTPKSIISISSSNLPKFGNMRNAVNQPQGVPAGIVAPKAIPARPKAIPARPKAIPARPKAIPARPMAIAARPMAISARPMAISARQMAISAPPKAIGARPKAPIPMGIPAF